MNKKKCFVIMPFGEKLDVSGKVVDFDKIYRFMIRPTIESADLECIRCDEVGVPGSIHAKMIEHIFHDEVVVVDITTHNPNVFYELGVRQALRPSVTVLIQKKGTKLPFNIQGLNVIEYDPEDIESVDIVKRKIAEHIRKGIRSLKSDSLVHDVLSLKIGTSPKPISKTETFVYIMKKYNDRSICITTGDLQRVKGIDIWVNSENTNMQMARFFDRSISSVIRYLGAEKNQAGLVVSDTIAEELTRIVGDQVTVPPATIIATTSGQLKKTHCVKMIFHAASATGALAQGYTPIPNVADCVLNSLAMVDSSEFEQYDLKSILFPLIGTGTARGSLHGLVASLIEAAIEYHNLNPNSRIKKVHFLAWSLEELIACRSVLDNSSDVIKQ